MNSKTIQPEAPILKKRLDFGPEDYVDPLFQRHCSDDDVAMIHCIRQNEFM